MPLTLRGNIRALPREAWFLFGGTLVNRFGSFVAVFLVLYLTKLGYSPAAAGAALSAYGFGSIAAALAGGHLADRIGRRRTIALSMFGSAGTMLGLSQARGLALLVVLIGLAGFFAELYRPATGALLADLVPEERRVTAFGIYRFAINLGFAAGPATAGLLADRSFFLLFVGDAITSTVFGIVALVALPEGRRSRREEERRGELLHALRRDRGFVLFLVASVLGAFVYFQSTASLPLHVVAEGFSAQTYGALISLNGLLVVLVELPLIAITQRLRARPVMATGSALVGIGFGLTLFADNLPLLALTVVIWTMGEIVHAPVASAYVASVAPPHLRGRYQGAWSLTWGIAFVVGPAVGTALFAASATALWLVCLLCGLAAAALILAAPERRVEPEPVALDAPAVVGSDP